MFMVAMYSFNEYFQVSSGKDSVMDNIVKVFTFMKYNVVGEINK